MKELFEIYISFFKMGAVTFGGGYAMLPILQNEVVDKKKWIETEKIIDYYALSQALPGIIAINVAVFIGYQRKKLLGAIFAALGMVTPCIFVITLIAAFLKNFQDNPVVRHAFAGVSICVAVLVLNSVIDLWKKGVVDKLGVILCIGVFLGTEFTKISPMIFVVGAALIGIITKTAGKKWAK